MKAFVLYLPKNLNRAKVTLQKLCDQGIAAEIRQGVLVNHIAGKCASIAETGCMFAHLKLLKEIASLRENVLVFEDDIRIRCGVNLKVEARRFWDDPMLLLGATQYEKLKGEKLPFDRTTRISYTATVRTCGAFAYRISPNFAQTILDYAKLEYKPFDHYLRELYRLTKIEVLYPNVVIADVSTSDIRGPRDIKKHANLVGWDLTQYEPAETQYT